MATPTRKPPIYTVYVIELSADVLTRRRFIEANPGYIYDPAHPPLDVGHSVRSPEERFEQHKIGKKASRYTRGNAICLRMDLAVRRLAELMGQCSVPLSGAGNVSDSTTVIINCHLFPYSERHE
jgi:hypothetical protein